MLQTHTQDVTRDERQRNQMYRKSEMGVQRVTFVVCWCPNINMLLGGAVTNWLNFMLQFKETKIVIIIIIICLSFCLQ